MKKFLGSKNAILILGILCILVIFYLIASLGSLDLKPAQPFAYGQESKALSSAAIPTWSGIGFILVFLVAFLVILFILLSPDQRKKFLFGLLGFALAGLIIFLVIFRLDLGRPKLRTPDTTVAVYGTPFSGQTETPEPLITPAVFTPPHVSSWTSYLVALLILLVGVGGWVWLVLRRRKTDVPLDALAEIARSALDDIEAGKDWGDTILNSYSRMNRVVADWRGIHRQTGMTPAEFAAYLVSTHLPGEAVINLTNLFERVRYGDKRSDPADIQQAVDCLTAIVEYCQAVK